MTFWYIVQTMEQRPRALKLKTDMRMIQAFVMEKCNHYQIGLILTSQFTLSGAGSNQVSHLLRSIRSNLDGTVIFPTNLKNLRHFLSSFTVGEQFQKMKSLFTYLLENSFSDDPADPRTGRPYVFISHGNNNANSYFSIRQFMFNLNDPLTKPFLPLAFINLKKWQIYPKKSHWHKLTLYQNTSLI